MIVRVATPAILLVFLLIFVGWPDVVQAQYVTLSVCKDLITQDLGAFGTRAVAVSCHREFSASDPYLVLFGEIAPIDTDTKIALELLNPYGATAFHDAGVLRPRPGERTRFTLAIILALSTDVKEIERKFPDIPIIKLGRPARERPGEWSWKVLLNPGLGSTLKFTLKPATPPQAQLTPPSPVASSAPTVPGPAVIIAKNEPITVAYWLVVAGPDANLGVDSRRGIEIAIDDKKTVVGRPIKLIGEDSGCNTRGGETAAMKLAANKDIVAAIGSSCSSGAHPGAPILWRAGIVTISPSNTDPRLTDPGRGPALDGYLRTSHNDKVQGILAAEFARKVLGVTRAATIHDGSPYAQGLQKFFAETFTRLGGTITAQKAIDPRDTDMHDVLARIAEGRPEVLYYPIFISAGGFVTRQTKEVPGLENVKLMGADGMFSRDFYRFAGQAAVGLYLTSLDLSVEAMGPGYREFLTKYQRKYDEPPISEFHAHAYDATMMIFAAIEKVAQTDASGDTTIGRRALRDALYGTRNFNGLTGTLTCNEYGDCADMHLAVYQIVSADPSSWSPGVNPKKIYP